MATDLVMNGVTFSGTPLTPLAPRKPTGLTMVQDKIGVVHVKDNGSREWVQRLSGATPIVKRTWEISWDKAHEVTRAALRTIDSLTSPWTFTNQLGVSYTVQTEPGDYQEDYATTDLANNIYYSIKMTVREV